MCWEHEAVEVIDEIICIVLKADKWQVLSNSLKVLLLKAWDVTVANAIDEAIKELEKGEEALTETDVKNLLTSLEDKLSFPLAQACQEAISDHQLKAYKQSFTMLDGKKLSVQFSFNKTSKDALKWLQMNETHWIGKYYKEQISEQLGERLSETSKGIFEQGLSRPDSAKLLRSACEDLFNTPEGFKGHFTQYWEGLSDHIVTKAREFGRIDAYDRAGIVFAKIVAVMDSRTSIICRELNGRVFPVAHLRELRDKIISAASPEEAKAVSPWLSDKKAKESVTGKTTADLLTDPLTKNLGSPPYHFKCRTITIGATKEEFESQENKE